MVSSVTLGTLLRQDKRADNTVREAVMERRKINLTQASRLLKQHFGSDVPGASLNNLSDLAVPGGKFEQAGLTVERPEYTPAVLVYEDELLAFWPVYMANTRRGRPKGKKP